MLTSTRLNAAAPRFGSHFTYQLSGLPAGKVSQQVQQAVTQDIRLLAQDIQALQKASQPSAQMTQGVQALRTPQSTVPGAAMVAMSVFYPEQPATSRPSLGTSIGTSAGTSQFPQAGQTRQTNGGYVTLSLPDQLDGLVHQRIIPRIQQLQQLQQQFPGSRIEGNLSPNAGNGPDTHLMLQQWLTQSLQPYPTPPGGSKTVDWVSTDGKDIGHTSNEGSVSQFTMTGEDGQPRQVQIRTHSYQSSQQLGDSPQAEQLLSQLFSPDALTAPFSSNSDKSALSGFGELDALIENILADPFFQNPIGGW